MKKKLEKKEYLVLETQQTIPLLTNKKYLILDFLFSKKINFQILNNNYNLIEAPGKKNTGRKGIQ